MTPQAFHVLLALAEKPMYVYGIIDQCQTDTSADLNFDRGGLYRTARRLEHMGLVAPAFELESHGSAHPRRYLTLTSAGKLVLKFESDRYHELAHLARYRLARKI